jgi:propionyl-CoA carboxylase alpha chain
MFYDPMIAKLCTWAPDRLSAIDEMRRALDAFEVEGIGHNLPFLSAVMDHPRFVSGEITTAFIEEEYPDGFAGVDPSGAVLHRLAAVAAFMKMRKEERAAQISGAMEHHRRTVGGDWVVFLGGATIPVTIDETDARTKVVFGDGTALRLTSDWTPGQTLFHGQIGGEEIIVKTELVGSGARLRYRGADLRAVVRTPRHAELASRMPVKVPPDTSKLLLCPMPGLVVRIDVEEGQEVQEGQTLCTVEAMKMENILRAERKGVVIRIHAEPGSSMGVDDVIMEFE